jgi:uncharacterized membrane protein
MLAKEIPFSFAALIQLCLVSSGLSAEQRFTAIDFPGTSGVTAAFGINDRGDIVGNYGPGDAHGFLLSKGKFTTIDFPGASATAARGINSEGDIVGLYCLQGLVPTLCNGTGLHGFLLSKGAFTTIDVPGAAYTTADGINPEGDIVGDYATTVGECGAVPGPGCHGFLLSKGTFTTIDVPGALGTTARGINPEGDIVGFYLNDTGFHGFLFSSGVFATIDAPGATLFSTAFSINPEGSIVGSRNNDGYLLKKGEFTFFDFPEAGVTTIPLGINAQGTIVGFYFSGVLGGNGHGFLLSK